MTSKPTISWPSISPRACSIAARTAAIQLCLADPVASCIRTMARRGAFALRATRSRPLGKRDRFLRQREQLGDRIDEREEAIAQHATGLPAGARSNEKAEHESEEERANTEAERAHELSFTGPWAGNPRACTP